MAQKHHKKRRRLKNALSKIKIVPTEEKLTAAAGLGTLIEIFDQSGLREAFAKCLPERVSHHSVGSYPMALTIMASFLYGYDCLEDLDYFRNDPKLKALFGTETAAARTHGDFLRDFEWEHIRALNSFLNSMARVIYKNLQTELPEEFRPKNLVVDVDSTSHVQHGNKMEGLAWNFKKEWCLDSRL